MTLAIIYKGLTLHFSPIMAKKERLKSRICKSHETTTYHQKTNSTKISQTMDVRRSPTQHWYKAVCFSSVFITVVVLSFAPSKVLQYLQNISNHLSNTTALKSHDQNPPSDKRDRIEYQPSESPPYIPTYQRSVSPKKIFLEGRRIALVELPPSKEPKAAHSVSGMLKKFCINIYLYFHSEFLLSLT